MRELINSILDTGGGIRIETTKQVIKFSMDLDISCCEHPGYFLSEDNPKDYLDSELLSIQVTDECLNKKELENQVDLYEGSALFVDINTNVGTLQFVAYNEHNGYYGHEVTIKSDQLNYRETL